jgi:cytochrome c553
METTMRTVCVALGLVVFAHVAAAQTPARQASRPLTLPPYKPDGSLAQLMRAIMFPDSNIIFDVQTNDPARPRKEPDPSERGALALFSSLYSGWDLVENAALALAEAPDLIMRPGRVCSNGKPAPLDRPDFVKFAQALREAARATYKAAQEKNQEKVADLTNNIADACVSCHTVYRNTPPGGEERCVPRLSALPPR